MFRDLAAQIEELEGIISCKITGDKTIDEIHIIASKQRDPKRIVRDIETMVLVNLDQEIDHKKISIAQINQSPGGVASNRIEIVSIYRENNRPVCHFKLNVNDKLVEESIEGVTNEELPLLVAEGIIDIIQRYTSFTGRIRVENVFTTGINNEIVIVQLILYKTPSLREAERLVGAAYVQHDMPLATGKACLKALNRRLNSYM